MSLDSRRSRKEADTWWHPPPKETEQDNHLVSNIESCGKRANSDWDLWSSGEHRVEVKEEVMSVTEVTEGNPSVDIAIRAFDQFSWDLPKVDGVAA